MIDIEKYNDDENGVRTFKSSEGEIVGHYWPPGQTKPVLEVNFSELARRFLVWLGVAEHGEIRSPESTRDAEEGADPGDRTPEGAPDLAPN